MLPPMTLAIRSSGMPSSISACVSAGSPAASKVVGTEPFWGIRIDGEILLYSTPETIDAPRRLEGARRVDGDGLQPGTLVRYKGLEVGKVETLGLTEYLKRKPKDLSGGQRQRVAMGRAIVREPKAFLMDEPLSNLDAKLRVQTRAELASLQQRLGTTTVYVTHDQVEAMTMGDRVAVLKDGELQQVAPPRELYDAPANEFVAGFIGSPAMNIFDYNGSRVGVRPEKMFINKGPVGFQGAVDIVEELGAESYVYVTVGDKRLVARAEGTPPQRGEEVVLTFNPREAHRFDPETGRRIAQD